MTKLVKQQGEYDCFLACMTMAVSWSEAQVSEIYTEAFLKKIEEAKGCYGDNMEKAFSEAFYPITTWYKTNVSHLKALPGRVGKNLLVDLLRGRRAIIQTASLNHEGKQHMVYWDGKNLFDPSNLKTYTEFDQLTPEWVYTFNESVTSLYEDIQ